MDSNLSDLIAQALTQVLEQRLEPLVNEIHNQQGLISNLQELIQQKAQNGAFCEGGVDGFDSRFGSRNVNRSFRNTTLFGKKIYSETMEDLIEQEKRAEKNRIRVEKLEQRRRIEELRKAEEDKLAAQLEKKRILEQQAKQKYEDLPLKEKLLLRKQEGSNQRKQNGQGRKIATVVHKNKAKESMQEVRTEVVEEKQVDFQKQEQYEEQLVEKEQVEEAIEQKIVEDQKQVNLLYKTSLGSKQDILDQQNVLSFVVLDNNEIAEEELQQLSQKDNEKPIFQVEDEIKGKLEWFDNQNLDDILTDATPQNLLAFRLLFQTLGLQLSSDNEEALKQVQEQFNQFASNNKLSQELVQNVEEKGDFTKQNVSLLENIISTYDQDNFPYTTHTVNDASYNLNALVSKILDFTALNYYASSDFMKHQRLSSN